MEKAHKKNNNNTVYGTTIQQSNTPLRSTQIDSSRVDSSRDDKCAKKHSGEGRTRRCGGRKVENWLPIGLRSGQATTK